MIRIFQTQQSTDCMRFRRSSSCNQPLRPLHFPIFCNLSKLNIGLNAKSLNFLVLDNATKVNPTLSLSPISTTARSRVRPWLLCIVIAQHKIMCSWVIWHEIPVDVFQLDACGVIGIMSVYCYSPTQESVLIYLRLLI